ncbi:MAG: 30S ribosomal protein S9 [Candidatus Moraniibacteriota bacterium]|nr:MAG: 30S ribosomal protein S9 [Candidatus Moranbacteria bacterium]
MTTTMTQQTTKDDQEKKVIVKKYYPGIGRRKTSVAQVRVYDEKVKDEESSLIVNGVDFEEYFSNLDFKKQAKRPLEFTGFMGKVRVTCVVRGGGMRGQAEAVRLGVARALVNMDAGLKPTLKSAGMITRNARKVERKKPGLKKARRAPQWSKR